VPLSGYSGYYLGIIRILDEIRSFIMLKQKYALVLSLLLVLFCLRVLGQLLVAFFHVPFLPPMEEWFSGVLSYPLLLASQILIVILYGKVCFDFATGTGYFVMPKLRLGVGLLNFGAIYLGVMVLRYALRMLLYPHERWIGGSIPIFFHWDLASFLLILGYYHWSSSRKLETNYSRVEPSLIKRIIRWLTIICIAIAIVLWMIYQIVPSLVAYNLGFPSAQYAVRTEKCVSMVTGNGIKLVADIYHPQHLEHTATILIRIPLSRTLEHSMFADVIGRMWAEHGYTVVIQGTRGRFGSQGIFYPLRNERQDGIDTLAWLSKQRWFNGKIVTWGGSASGYTQWIIADQTNPGPSALTIYLASTDFYGMFYPGSAFSLYSALSWALTSNGHEDRTEWPSTEEILKAATGFPMVDADKRAVDAEISFFRDWANHPQRDSYWIDIDGNDRNKTLKAPALLLCGWYDPFLPTQLNDFVQIKKSAPLEIASRSRLIIGPWTHAGQVIFPNGKEAENFRLQSLAISLPWFDANLCPPPSGQQDNFPVKIFVMGINKWRLEKEWPLARARYVPFYLSSNVKANSVAGDGSLDVSPSTKEDSKDTYTYDPRNPVPTAGGAMLGKAAGVAKQNEIESRSDVLVFTTPILKEDIEVTGPITLILYVSTSAVNTDFTGKLVDVYPNGCTYNISDGIIRRQYKLPNQATKNSPIKKLEIQLWPTSTVFFKGHRIRLEVSSSNFPRYDRNPNTGNPIAQEITVIVAHQNVHHDLRYPSRLILPIVRGLENK